MLKTNEITTTKLSNIGHSNQPTKGKYTMTNLYTALKTFLTSPRSTRKSTRLAHYRSTGMTGQVLASTITGKLLDEMHKSLSSALKTGKEVVGVKLTVEEDYHFVIPNLRFIARGVRGKQKKVA